MPLPLHFLFGQSILLVCCSVAGDSLAGQLAPKTWPIFYLCLYTNGNSFIDFAQSEKSCQFCPSLMLVNSAIFSLDTDT